MILSIKFQTILKIISHYFQNQSSTLKKTKDLRIRSPRIGQNNAEIGLAARDRPRSGFSPLKVLRVGSARWSGSSVRVRKVNSSHFIHQTVILVASKGKTAAVDL